MNGFIYNTKIGSMAISEENGYIKKISLGGFYDIKNVNLCETPVIKECAKQLFEYFIGTRQTFDLPLDPDGTEFQKSVWSALTQIPYGETRSYSDIAASMGKPKVSRAIGMANNRNPIMIVIPCHRVVGKNGNLVGYAGGLSIKERLLKIENPDFKVAAGSNDAEPERESF